MTHRAKYIKTSQLGIKIYKITQVSTNTHKGYVYIHTSGNREAVDILGRSVFMPPSWDNAVNEARKDIP